MQPCVPGCGLLSCSGMQLSPDSTCGGRSMPPRCRAPGAWWLQGWRRDLLPATAAAPAQLHQGVVEAPPLPQSHSDSLTPSPSASAVIEFAGVAGLSLGTAWVTGRGPDGDGFTDRGPGDRARDTRSGTEGESPRQAMSRLDMRRFPLSRCRSPTCVTRSDVLDVRCVAVTAAPSESGPPATATATATDQTRGGALAYSLWAWTSGGRCGGANLRTCGGWTCVEQVWRWW